MTKVRFSRQGDRAIIEMGGEQIALSDGELISALSALTTPNSVFEAQANTLESLPTSEPLLPSKRSTAPSPSSVIPRMGQILGSVEVEVPAHVSNPSLQRPAHYSPPRELSYAHGVLNWVEHLGMTDSDVVDIMDDPEDEWISNDGKVAILLRGNVALEVAIDNDQVLGAFEAEYAKRRFPREGATEDRRNFSGGGAGRYSQDIKELIKRLRELGVEVTRTGTGHYRVQNDRGFYVIPSTPSHGRRSLINCIKSVERELQVSLRSE